MPQSLSHLEQQRRSYLPNFPAWAIFAPDGSPESSAGAAPECHDLLCPSLRAPKNRNLRTTRDLL